MNYSDLELLTRIYNTLLLVNTKGEDTMIMGECLRTLQNFVLTKKQEIENNNQKEEE
jgi:hypothetical protein